MAFLALLRKLFPSKGPLMTPRAALVVTHAREEALRRQQAATVQHLSIALLDLNQGCARGVLARRAIDTGALYKTAAAQIETTPLDSALEAAHAEQRRFGHYYLGTEHLLLALIQDGQNAVAQFLQQQGMDLAKARELVLLELDPTLEEREEKGSAI
jgi:ATP-dependent Clp protease ATP-binding subunit ClpC